MRTEASAVKIKILTTVHCSKGKQENVDAQTTNIPFLPLFYALKNIRGVILQPSSPVDLKRNYMSNYGNQDTVQQIKPHLLYQPLYKSILVPTC